MDYGNLLFSFDGRINRAKYWIGALILLGVWIVVGGIGYWLLTSVNPWIGGILLLIVFVPAFIAGLAIAIKRLHDRDKSGWWVLLFYFVPSILSQIGQQIGGAGLILSLGGFAISIWAFVEIGCLRGTVGPNQYGPDPLGGMVQQPA
jgi:uncharacterized membrane protein YhaH (DUF805 family)